MKEHSFLFDCLLTIAFCVGLCACGSDSSSGLSPEDNPPSSSSEPDVESSSENASSSSTPSSSSKKVESSSSFASISLGRDISDYLEELGYDVHQGIDDKSSSSTASSDNDVRASYFNMNLSYGEMTDSRDDQVYKTIVIGEQTWMAENLNYNGFEDGAYNRYSHNPDSSKKYGVGYVFYKAINACPENWHLPTTPEWETMIDYVASHTETPVGKALKSTIGWPPTRTGTNEFGFNAVFDINDYKTYGIIQAYYWTSTVPNDVSTVRYVFALEFDSDDMKEQGVYEGKYQPIRCIKDSPNSTPSEPKEGQ